MQNKLIMLIVAICVSTSTVWATAAKCKFYLKGNCFLCGGFMTKLIRTEKHCQEWVPDPDFPDSEILVYVSKSHYGPGFVTHDPNQCTE